MNWMKMKRAKSAIMLEDGFVAEKFILQSLEEFPDQRHSGNELSFDESPTSGRAISVTGADVTADRSLAD